MAHFKNTLAAWNSESFETCLQQEVSDLSVDELLLQQALVTGSYASKENLKVIINHREENTTTIIIDCGIFFSSYIAGCNCADDPTPQDSYHEYCELRFIIEKNGATTKIYLID